MYVPEVMDEMSFKINKASVEKKNYSILLKTGRGKK